jgi:hypothetical protein
MKHIGFVPGAVGNATVLFVLALQYKGDQFVGIDPIQTIKNGHDGQHPPTVTHVRLFFRTAVQPT